MSNSRPYYQDDITWCVQKAKLRAKWKQILITADLNTCLCIVAAVAPVLCIGYFLTAFERRPLDIWSVAFLLCRTISLTSATFYPERKTTRAFFVLHLHLCFVTSCLFTSLMFQIITNPNHEHQISGFDEISYAKLRLAAEVEMKMFLIDRNMVNNNKIKRVELA